MRDIQIFSYVEIDRGLLRSIRRQVNQPKSRKPLSRLDLRSSANPETELDPSFPS
jgi:hypothetical protein